MKVLSKIRLCLSLLFLIFAPVLYTVLLEHLPPSIMTERFCTDILFSPMQFAIVTVYGLSALDVAIITTYKFVNWVNSL